MEAGAGRGNGGGGQGRPSTEVGSSARLLSALDTHTPGVWASLDACGAGDTGPRGGCVCDGHVLGPDLACGSGGHGGLGHVDTLLPVYSYVRIHTCTPACAFLCVCARPRAGDFLGSRSGSVWWEELGQGWAAARTCCNPGLCPPQL